MHWVETTFSCGMILRIDTPDEDTPEFIINECCPYVLINKLSDVYIDTQRRLISDRHKFPHRSSTRSLSEHESLPTPSFCIWIPFLSTYRTVIQLIFQHHRVMCRWIYICRHEELRTTVWSLKFNAHVFVSQRRNKHSSRSPVVFTRARNPSTCLRLAV